MERQAEREEPAKETWAWEKAAGVGRVTPETRKESGVSTRSVRPVVSRTRECPRDVARKGPP